MSNPPRAKWPKPTRILPAVDLQAYFNRNDLEQRAASGEFIVEIHDEYHPQTLKHEPFCTWTRVYRYLSHDREPIALVHQYERPDGTLGGSGRADPKSLVVGDEVWAC